MDNIEHGPEQVKAPVGPGAGGGKADGGKEKEGWVGI
jgi:hypothetical protein